MIGLCMVALLLSAFGKLADIPGFVAALATWSLLPAGSRLPVACALPSVEIIIAGMWLLRLRPNLAEWAAGDFLAAVTGVYAVHMTQLETPNCNCLGAWETFRLARYADEHVLFRNGILLVSRLEK
jgi:hypothetical protein